MPPLVREQGKAGQLAPLTVIVPTKDEANNLPAALASVAWCEQVLVVDSASGDGTAEIARSVGADVRQFQYAGGAERKKNWALDNLPIRNDWVLLLDADERVTPSLREEMKGAVLSRTADGYCIDREFIFMGRSLRCFRPNWNLRLFKHRLGRFEDLGLHRLPGTGDTEVHEHVALDGEIGFLNSPLVHEDYRGLTAWIDRHNRYATWEAHLYRRFRDDPVDFGPVGLWRLDPFRRKRALRRLWTRLPARPILRFVVWYVFRRGFLDGRIGLIFCLLMAWYELIIGIKLQELGREQLPRHSPRDAGSCGGSGGT